jgi:hypothetical protein
MIWLAAQGGGGEDGGGRQVDSQADTPLWRDFDLDLKFDSPPKDLCYGIIMTFNKCAK